LSVDGRGLGECNMYESVSDPRIVEDVGAEDQKVANLRNSGVMRPIPLPITILSR